MLLPWVRSCRNSQSRGRPNNFRGPAADAGLLLYKMDDVSLFIDVPLFRRMDGRNPSPTLRRLEARMISPARNWTQTWEHDFGFIEVPVTFDESEFIRSLEPLLAEVFDWAEGILLTPAEQLVLAANKE